MTRPRTRFPLSACALGLAAVTLIGCSPTPEPTPTPTPAFASEEEAFAAAEETYRAYIDASNKVDLQDPNTFAAIEAYTDERYQADERRTLSEAHAEGYVSHGDIAVEWFKGISAEGDGAVRAIACNDVSQTTLVDRKGKSLVAEDRPARYALALRFSAADGQLKLSQADTAESDECAAE